MSEIKKQFILLRGLPGSGKSTKAKELAGEQGQVFSTDDYFCLNEHQVYKFDSQKLGKAHTWNQRRSLEAVKIGIPVIVIDNTNTTVREMRSYIEHIKLAQFKGYEVLIVEPETWWQFDLYELDRKNTHDVPKEHIQKMLNRYVKKITVFDILAEE